MSENPKEINEILEVIYGVASNIRLNFIPNKCKSLATLEVIMIRLRLN